MSTSANVIHYTVKDKSNRVVGEYRHNRMCKALYKEKMKEHQPPEDFTVELRWPDEDEVDHFSKPISLADYLNSTYYKPVTIEWED